MLSVWVQCRVLEALACTYIDHSVLKASPQGSLIGIEQKEHTKKHTINLMRLRERERWQVKYRLLHILGNGVKNGKNATTM